MNPRRRLAVPSLLLVASIALCSVFASAQPPSPRSSTDPHTALVADEAASVRAVFVLPDSSLVPPAAQLQALQGAGATELAAGNVALVTHLAPGGRLLHVEFHANPFATEEHPTANADALFSLGARVIARWQADLAAIAAADARQRQAQLRAKQAEQAAIAKQKSLAAAARVEALKPMLAGASEDSRDAIAGALRDAMIGLTHAIGEVAALKAADMAQATAVPIVPEIVPELGDGKELQRRIGGD